MAVITSSVAKITFVVVEVNINVVVITYLVAKSTLVVVELFLKWL